MKASGIECPGIQMDSPCRRLSDKERCAVVLVSVLEVEILVLVVFDWSWSPRRWVYREPAEDSRDRVQGDERGLN